MGWSVVQNFYRRALYGKGVIQSTVSGKRHTYHLVRELHRELLRNHVLVSVEAASPAIFCWYIILEDAHQCMFLTTLHRL